MKKILTVLASTLVFTGCASTTGEGSYGKMIALSYVSPELAGHEAVKLGLAKYPTDQAAENCQKIGYRTGTDAFKQCVVVTANNIRNARAQSEIARSIENSTMQSTMPKTIRCRQVGSYVHCNEL